MSNRSSSKPACGLNRLQMGQLGLIEIVRLEFDEQEAVQIFISAAATLLTNRFGPERAQQIAIPAMEEVFLNMRSNLN